MDIQQRTVEPDITVFGLQGRIVLGSEGMAVRKAIEESLENGRNKLVIDMAGVSYVDSAGVGILISLMSKTKESQGEFRLTGTNKSVTQVLKITNVVKLLSLDDSVDDAVAAIRGGATP